MGLNTSNTPELIFKKEIRVIRRTKGAWRRQNRSFKIQKSINCRRRKKLFFHCRYFFNYYVLFYFKLIDIEQKNSPSPPPPPFFFLQLFQS